MSGQVMRRLAAHRSHLLVGFAARYRLTSLLGLGVFRIHGSGDRAIVWSPSWVLEQGDLCSALLHSYVLCLIDIRLATERFLIAKSC